MSNENKKKKDIKNAHTQEDFKKQNLCKMEIDKDDKKKEDGLKRNSKDKENTDDFSNYQNDENKIDSEKEMEINNSYNDSFLDIDLEIYDPNVKFKNLYEKYHEMFKKVYSHSQNLFSLERAQKQTMRFYQRRNNAFLDVLDQFEGFFNNKIIKENLTTNKIVFNNIESLKKIVKLSPQTNETLESLIEYYSTDSGTKTDNIEKNYYFLQKKYLIDLFVNESIPDLVSDDLTMIESNPQDTKHWCRRSFPNLIPSTFNPLIFPSNGFFYEYDENDFSMAHDESKTKNNNMNTKLTKGNSFKAFVNSSQSCAGADTEKKKRKQVKDNNQKKVKASNTC